MSLCGHPDYYKTTTLDWVNLFKIQSILNEIYKSYNSFKKKDQSNFLEKFNQYLNGNGLFNSSKLFN
jgi:hypothetical protein